MRKLLAILMLASVAGAAEFDGVDDYVDCGSAAELDNMNALTWMGWVNYTPDTGEYPAILSKNRNSDSGTGRYLSIKAENTVRYFIRGGSNYKVESTDTVSSGWHHIAFTKPTGGDASDAVIYIDGQAVSGYAEQDDDAPANWDDDSNEPLTVGQIGGTCRIGTFADVRIYDYVLTTSEVATLYAQDAERRQGTNCYTDTGFFNAGDVPETYDTNGVNHLVFSWDGHHKGFATGQEIVEVKDVSPSQNHGTLEPSPSTGPTWQDSVTDGSNVTQAGVYDFDGANDYIDLSVVDLDGAFAGGSTAFTIAGWIKPDSLGSEKSGHDVRNVLISKGSDSDNDNIEIGVSDGGNLDIYLDDQYGDTTRTRGNGEITTGSWHHFAVTYDGENISIYLNDNYYTDNLDPSSMDDAQSHITIGCTTHSDIYFDGQMDNIYAYNSALTSNQVHNLYLGTDPTNTPVLYMPFDNNTIIATSQDPNQHTLTFHGGVTETEY